MGVELKQLPSFRLACARKVGPYGPELAGVWEKVMDWRAQRKLHNNPVIGIGWDDPSKTPAEECRYDACVVLPDMNLPDQEVFDTGLSVLRLPEGLYACHRRRTDMTEYREAYSTLLAWVAENQYECAGPPFEWYHLPYSSDINEVPLDISFCVSIKPKN